VIGDDKGLPASITGLFGTAFTLFFRRFSLYATLAVAAFAVQFFVDLAVMQDTGLALGLNIVVGSFVAAAVSIGVAFDIAHKDADWSTIFNAAALRWGVVVVIDLVSYLVQNLVLANMFLPPDETGYGLLLVPLIVMWGAVMMASVVAAIDPAKSRLTLPAVALAKGIVVSLQFANLGRLMLFSLVAALPLIAEILLRQFLVTRGVPEPDFWSGIPIDAIAAGPLQALATVFYIDFLRRAKR
jgi:hypothetical protein